MKNFDYVVNYDGKAGVYYNKEIHIVVDNDGEEITDVESFKPAFALRFALDVAILERKMENNLEILLMEFPELSFNIKQNKTTMFVAVLQFILKIKGFDCGSYSGKLDDHTMKQIEAFAKQNEIEPIVNKYFWLKLIKE